jgi:hypothetical protein
MARMPMECFQFEDQLERAVASILLKNGVNDVAKQRDSQVELPDGKKMTLKTPRVEAKYLSAGLSRKHYHPASGMPDLSDGILYLKIITRRDVAEPSHAYLRGLCRYLMLFVSDISAVMKFHKIEEMFETQSTTSFEADKNHDVSALTFQTCLRIRSEWFPTS